MLDAYGPWANGINLGERSARCRIFAALVLVFWRSDQELVEALKHASRDLRQLPHAKAMFDSLPAIPKRRILCTFADLISSARK